MGYAEWMAGTEQLPSFQRPSMSLGALGGMGKGALAGMALGPIGGLIGAGIGGISSLIGAGMKGAQEQKMYKQQRADMLRKEDYQKEQDDLTRGETERDQNMRGMEMLAASRDRAMRDFRNQQYRDGVAKLLQGAA